MLEELSQDRLMEGRAQEFKCYSNHNREPSKDFKQRSNMVQFPPHSRGVGLEGIRTESAPLPMTPLEVMQCSGGRQWWACTETEAWGWQA